MTDLYTLTKDGCDWSEVVNEIEWLQESKGDLTAAMVVIESQLPDEYWDMDSPLTIHVPADVAALIDEAHEAGE